MFSRFGNVLCLGALPTLLIALILDRYYPSAPYGLILPVTLVELYVFGRLIVKLFRIEGLSRK